MAKVVKRYSTAEFKREAATLWVTSLRTATFPERVKCRAGGVQASRLFWLAGSPAAAQGYVPP